MRRLLKFSLIVAGALLALLVVVLGGFHIAAVLRQSQTPQQAAGQGAAFARADDVDAHYIVWGPQDGEPLVLLHGTVSWAETYRQIAEPLAARGYRVIGVDMPPFGYATKPLSQDYSRAAQARRILAFADSIGLERFSLGVHSYGGGGALEAAFQQPQRFRSLILLDVALGLEQTEASGPPLGPLMRIGPLRTVLASATFANPMTLGMGLRQFIHDDALVTDELIEIYSRPLAVQGTSTATGHWFVKGLFGDHSASEAARFENYRAFKKPVLVIWGREDQTTPLAQGVQIADLLPFARLEVLEGVDHIPQIENPTEVIRLIDDFLKSLPSEPELRGPVR